MKRQELYSSNHTRRRDYFTLHYLWACAGIIGIGVVGVTGISRAFLKEGGDFSVFYKAWRLVVEGRGLEIYRESPDRFLYAPGFAWALSPLGYLDREFALVLWSAAKLGLLG